MTRRLMQRRELSKALLATATGAPWFQLPLMARRACHLVTHRHPRKPMRASYPPIPRTLLTTSSATVRPGTERPMTRAPFKTAIDVQNNWQVYSAALGNKFTAGPDFRARR